MYISLLYVFVSAATAVALPVTPTADETLCHEDHLNIINQFLLDGALLANSTLEKKLHDGTDFVHSTAYRNYFEVEDYEHVTAIYKAINDYWFHPNNQLNLWLVCPHPGGQPKTCSSNTQPLAFADPDPSPYTWNASQWFPSSGLGFCSSFFDPVQTDSNTHYFSKTDQDWCTGLSFEDFLAAGYYSIKLLAQTELMGSFAKLPLRDVDHTVSGLYPRNQTHGAFQIGGLEPWNAARMLKQQWTGALKPNYRRIQSAVSYAAAATEWFFLIKCGKERDYSIPS